MYDKNQERYREARQRLDQLSQLADRHGLLQLPFIRKWLFHLELSPTDTILADHIEGLIQQNKDNPLLKIAAPESLEALYGPGGKPDFRVGQTTLTGVEYGPQLVKGSSNCMISGVNNGGKSSLVMHLINGFYFKHPTVGIFIPDLKNECSYVGQFPLHRINVHPYTCIRLNLLRPPRGIELTAWLAIVATTIAVYRGLIKSRHVLLDCLIELCKLFGVDINPNRPWPTFQNLIEIIGNRPRKLFDKLGQYQASLLNELMGFLKDSSNIFNTSDGLPVSELSRPGQIFVLQLKNLETSVQQILISLVGIYHIIDQESQGKQNLPMRTCIVLDEAQMVLARIKDREAPNGLTPLAHQLIQGRSSGTAMVTVTHLPDQISTAVLSSAQTVYVVGGTSDADNAYLMGKMMNLSHQTLPVFSKLRQGQMLVREIGLEFKEPFLVDIDPPPLDKNAIDETTLDELMAYKRAEFSPTPARSLSEYTRINPDQEHSSSTEKTPSPPPNETSLDQEQLDILNDAVRHWDDFNAIRCKRLKIKDYQHFNQQLKILEGQGFLVRHKMTIGSKTPIFIEVTEKGFQAVGKVRPPDYCGKGGFEHAVTGRLTEKNRKSLHWKNCQREFPVGPKPHLIDLYGISPEGVVTGFEISLSMSNVVANAINSLTGSNLHRLVFLCCTQSEARKVEALLKKDAQVVALMARISCECLDKYIY
jgi:hypothetical protein